jgi:hypothetical protein
MFFIDEFLNWGEAEPFTSYQLKESATGKILLEDLDKQKLEVVLKMMEYAYLSGKMDQLVNVANAKQEDIISCL